MLWRTIIALNFFFTAQAVVNNDIIHISFHHTITLVQLPSYDLMARQKCEPRTNSAVQHTPLASAERMDIDVVRCATRLMLRDAISCSTALFLLLEMSIIIVE